MSGVMSSLRILLPHQLLWLFIIPTVTRCTALGTIALQGFIRHYHAARLTTHRSTFTDRARSPHATRWSCARSRNRLGIPQSCATLDPVCLPHGTSSPSSCILLHDFAPCSPPRFSPFSFSLARGYESFRILPFP